MTPRKQTPPAAQRDVFFLLADSAMAEMIRGFFGRDGFHRSLGCAPFDFDPIRDLIVASTKDPGVYTTACELLRPYQRSHRRAVVMLDDAWNGSPGPERIRKRISEDMKASAWSDVAVIVIEPELEAWIWQESNPHIATALKAPENYRELLAKSDHWPLGLPKPPDPKAALDHLRRKHRADRQNAAFRRLAAKISVKYCTDPAFATLRTTLQTWFPET